jgi:tRNA G46 methylase TrmB
VQVTSIDAYVAQLGAPPIAFIKIDVQGYEPAVLRGMRRTLAQNPQACVAVEFMPTALVELGFDDGEFLRELADARPQLSILERAGGLRAANISDILRATQDSELGYVDLVCLSTRS